jgi:hypothetical protein
MTSAAIRTITVQRTGETYLHKADVAAYLVEIAATETWGTTK